MQRTLLTVIPLFSAAAFCKYVVKHKIMASSGDTEEFKKRGPEESGWIATTYNCYWEKFKRPGMLALYKWKFKTSNESNIPKDEKTLDKYMPVHRVGRETLSKPSDGKMRVTWIGHATVLTQFDGINVLSDPLFRSFCGPEQAQTIKSLGYHRYRRAACTAKDIPELDVVIISHNHFDHLDRGSVTEILEQHKDVTWFVPMKMKAWFMNHGVTDERKVIEMTWWQEKEFKKNGKTFKFICLPAQHWCQRGALDLNKVLWCSWAVKGPDNSYFFGGDTGYHGPLFKTIGNDYGPFSFAAIPIGAYHPREITEFQHVNPEEAVNIHQDIRSNQSVGIHWGTFELTNEFFLEPPNKVRDLMESKQKDPKKFISLMLGETWTVGEERQESPFMGINTVRDMKPVGEDNRSTKVSSVI